MAKFKDLLNEVGVVGIPAIGFFGGARNKDGVKVDSDAVKDIWRGTRGRSTSNEVVSLAKKIVLAESTTSSLVLQRTDEGTFNIIHRNGSKETIYELDDTVVSELGLLFL